ncbi:MAG: M14 family zinc carboxypeptidase [Planctomycetota bacterium]
MKLSYVMVLVAGAWLTLGTRPVAADTWPTYSEIGPALQTYETTYPNLCKRYDLGLSVGGRHLWAIRISDDVLVEEDEPEFKYIATMHGDEIVGTKMCMMLIDFLLTNYGTDPQATNIVNEVELWIVPLMNPDGYDRSPRSRYNNNGVDLNRDFPEGTEGDPNTTAGRQVETAVIMNWSFGRSFTQAANFHGGALVANYPFDNDGMGSVYSPTPDDDMFIWISEEYSQYNLPMWNNPSFYHGITNGADWYAISGGMQDWDYRYMGGNEVTIELGNTKEPSASQIPTLWNDNRESMQAYIETTLIGIRGLVTDGVTGSPVLATVRVVGRDHDVYTDPDVGDYHRMLLPGTYSLTFTAGGYDSETRTNVVVTSGDATRLDVPMYGAPLVVSPNGGEMLTAGVPTTVTWIGNPAAQYQVQYTENYASSGTVSDGFERTSLGPDYTTGGNAPWVTSTTSAHSGSRSAKAGTITHSQQTWMTRTADGGPLSFWFKVSSEANYDWFNFYEDGVRKVHRSGIMSAFEQYSTTLTPGTHVLKWEYIKDISVSSGSDTAWVDDLQLTTDSTVWTDIIALTAPGAMSTPWTPTNPGTTYKVRVRSYKDGGYGSWDESDAVFSVVAPPTADGDYDGDTDVDLVDFGWFQLCFGSSPSSECKAAFDFDGDATVDLPDFAEFVPLLDASGPGN